MKYCQELENWKAKCCDAIEFDGDGDNLVCITPLGVEVYKGYGCNGCPYK